MSNIKYVDELIRKVTNHLMTPHHRFDYITKPQLKQRLMLTNPECFISLKRLGRDTSEYLLPICNRAGIVDPVMINVSYKLVQRLMNTNNGLFNTEDLQKVLSKLQYLRNRYKKDIVKPMQQAARKGLVTRLFRNIKSYLLLVGGHKTSN